MSFYRKIAPVAKAITGAVVAGLGALGVALTPDESGLVSVTPAEWVAAAVATLVASYAVWQIPNEDTPEQVEAKVALAEKRAEDSAPDGHQGELDF